MDFFNMLGPKLSSTSVVFDSKVVFFEGEYLLPLNASPLDGTVTVTTLGIGSYEIKKNANGLNVAALKMLATADQVVDKAISVQFNYTYVIPCTWWHNQRASMPAFAVNSVSMGIISGNPAIGFSSAVHEDFISNTYFKIKKVSDDSEVAGLSVTPDSANKVITFTGTLPTEGLYFWVDKNVKGVNGLTVNDYLGRDYTNKFTVPLNMSPVVSSIEISNATIGGLNIRGAVTDTESDTITEITIQVTKDDDVNWLTPTEAVLSTVGDIDAFRINVTASDWYYLTATLDNANYKSRVKAKDSGSGVYGSWVNGPTFVGGYWSDTFEDASINTNLIYVDQSVTGLVTETGGELRGANDVANKFLIRSVGVISKALNGEIYAKPKFITGTTAGAQTLALLGSASNLAGIGTGWDDYAAFFNIDQNGNIQARYYSPTNAAYMYDKSTDTFITGTTPADTNMCSTQVANGEVYELKIQIDEVNSKFRYVAVKGAETKATPWVAFVDVRFGSNTNFYAGYGRDFNTTYAYPVTQTEVGYRART